MVKKSIFVWNNSAVTNALINKLSDSKNIDKVYYSGCRNLVNKQNQIEIPARGLLKNIKNKNVEFVFSNSQANGRGFVDIVCRCKFKGIGVNYKALKLEASKICSKNLMVKYGINTAKYHVLENALDIDKNIGKIKYPSFLKADGYARSLSSIRIQNENEYITLSKKYLDGYYGEDSQKIIVENEIVGREVSIPLVLDSKTIKILLPVKDYKRKEYDKTSENTGGMGSIAPIALNDIQSKLLGNLIDKLTNLLKSENLFYKGFMTINVIFTSNDIYLLEMNTRLGDSEGQVILELLDSDIIELFDVIWEEKLDEYNIKWKDGYALAVNIINKNYPNNREHLTAGLTIKSLLNLYKKNNNIFLYGDIENKEENYTGKERLVSIVEVGMSIDEIRSLIYDEIRTIESFNSFYRKDIGL